MSKKILSHFAPLLVAFVILGLIFCWPTKKAIEKPKVWQQASTSMASNVFGGMAIKNPAIASGEYVPFFGSSELSRLSPFHPSVLAEKYQRPYRPFLLGAPGTQSLSQFAISNSLSKELTNKKAVFIISPQWFTKKGMEDLEFNAYFSELELYHWLLSIDQVRDSDRYYAQRLLNFSRIKDNPKMSAILTSIANGSNQLSIKQRHYLKYNYQLLQKEDHLFTQVGMLSKEKKINFFAQKLPNEYNYQALDTLAEKIGQKHTNNNRFEIDNGFYKARLEIGLKGLKNSQRRWNYCQSPEFADFQLVLNQFAQSHTQVLFIIPPVNQKWSDYTGLSQEMLQRFAKKIKYQLQSQGFTDIADFSKDANVRFFMADTIHLGWRGWLRADEAIAPFLAQPYQPTNYHLNNAKFFSKEWQDQENIE